jgi:hypothetical protein
MRVFSKLSAVCAVPAVSARPLDHCTVTALPVGHSGDFLEFLVVFWKNAGLRSMPILPVFLDILVNVAFLRTWSAPQR